MSPSPNRRRQRGFTLIEVLASIVVLTIAATALAGLAGAMLTKGHQSKYMTLAGTLASEKLEDLSHWNADVDQATGNDISADDICVPSPDTSEGTLADPSQPSDLTAPPYSKNITCNGDTEPVTYYDNVSINITTSVDCTSTGDGCFAETTSQTVGGVTTYTTTYHSPDGQIQTPAPSATAPAGLAFRRYWQIEANTPVATASVAGKYVPGTRRITVRVVSIDPSINPPVSFQMSMVRP